MIRTNLMYASYLRHVLSPEGIKKYVDEAVKNITLFQAAHPFDTIAFCGMSGSAMAYPLSYLMQKHTVCVRKPEIEAHSWAKTEGVFDFDTYIIVDDLIDSGKTMRLITSSMQLHAAQAKCVGIYLFHPTYTRPKQFEGIPVIQHAFEDPEWLGDPRL